MGTQSHDGRQAMGARMMLHVQSSPATDHRFCPIMGCSVFHCAANDPNDPTMTPEPGAWGHGFLQPFQWVADDMTPMTPYSTEKTCGKQALAKGQLQGGQAGWANIGSLGSCGVMGSCGVTGGCKRSSPLFDHRFFPRGPGRGDTDPRKNTLCKNFRIVRQRNVAI